MFVRHALPGERVRARVTEDGGGSFCRADAVEVLDRLAGPGEPRRARTPGRDAAAAATGSTPTGPAQRRLKAAGRARAVRAASPASSSSSTRSRSCPAACSAGAPGCCSPSDRGGAGRAAPAPLARARAGGALPARRARGRRRAPASRPGATGIEAVARRRRRDAVLGAPARARAARPAAAARRTGSTVVAGPEQVRHHLGDREFAVRRGRLLAGAPGRARRRSPPRCWTGSRRGRGERARPLRRRRAADRRRWPRRSGRPARCSGSSPTRPAVADAAAQPGRPAVGARSSAAGSSPARSPAARCRPGRARPAARRRGHGRRWRRSLDLAPRAVGYVSCDPATLARDVAGRARRGAGARVAAGVRRLPDDPPHRVRGRARTPVGRARRGGFCTVNTRVARSLSGMTDVLSRVHSPADLRGLSREELTLLAAEIRDLLVQTVSRTGGHLGPNLGAVELTIALHRSFDSPTEPILFDVGPPGLRPQDPHRPRRAVPDPAPDRRPVRLPEPRREPPRLDRELARLDGAVLRRRAGQGLRRSATSGVRSSRWSATAR